MEQALASFSVLLAFWSSNVNGTIFQFLRLKAYLCFQFYSLYFYVLASLSLWVSASWQRRIWSRCTLSVQSRVWHRAHLFVYPMTVCVPESHISLHCTKDIWSLHWMKVLFWLQLNYSKFYTRNWNSFLKFPFSLRLILASKVDVFCMEESQKSPVDVLGKFSWQKLREDAR